MLRSRPYGESDLIVTALTRTSGKLAAIAKGAKRSRRRFVGLLEPFAHIELRFRPRPSGLAFLVAADPIRIYRHLAADLDKFAYASYLVELTDRLSGDAEPGVDLYELLRAGLESLDHSTPTSALLRAFELHCLRVTGYALSLEQCRRCRRSLPAQASVSFEPEAGVFTCQACNPPRATLRVRGVTVGALAALTRHPLGERWTVTLPHPIASEARRLLAAATEPRLRGRLRSTDLLAQLGHEP